MARFYFILTLLVVALSGAMTDLEPGMPPSAAADEVELIEEAGDAEDARKGQVAQFEQMLQPRMWRELKFIRLTCDLTPDQRPKIKAAVVASVKKAAMNLVGVRFDGEGDPASAVYGN